MGIDLPLQKSNAINTDDLAKVAQANPQYTKLLLGLAQIDAYIKQVCKGIVSTITDADIYSLKTELTPTSYSLFLYNSERNAIVGTTWTISTLLAECQSKTISSDVDAQVRKMVDTLGEANIKTGRDINWV